MDRFRDFHFVEGASPMSTWIAPTIGLVVYICAITILSRRSGPPIKTKTAEVLHNSLLVVLSFVTMVGVVVGAIRRGREDGWEGLICSPREPKSLWDGYLGGWSYLFYLTKYYELLDTVILALKKKPLLPLHVYHHAVMLFVGWSWFAFSWLEGSWWCAFLNSLIHTAMYSYYLLVSPHSPHYTLDSVLFAAHLLLHLAATFSLLSDDFGAASVVEEVPYRRTDDTVHDWEHLHVHLLLQGLAKWLRGKRLHCRLFYCCEQQFPAPIRLLLPFYVPG